MSRIFPKLLSKTVTVQLVLRGRIDVGEARQELPVAVDIDGDALDAVDDFVGS